jgi:hypothetical protein
MGKGYCQILPRKNLIAGRRLALKIRKERIACLYIYLGSELILMDEDSKREKLIEAERIDRPRYLPCWTMRAKGCTILIPSNSPTGLYDNPSPVVLHKLVSWRTFSLLTLQWLWIHSALNVRPKNRTNFRNRRHLFP